MTNWKLRFNNLKPNLIANLIKIWVSHQVLKKSDKLAISTIPLSYYAKQRMLGQFN